MPRSFPRTEMPHGRHYFHELLPQATGWLSIALFCHLLTDSLLSLRRSTWTKEDSMRLKLFLLTLGRRNLEHSERRLSLVWHNDEYYRRFGRCVIRFINQSHWLMCDKKSSNESIICSSWLSILALFNCLFNYDVILRLINGTTISPFSHLLPPPNLNNKG